jgi:hypothetical protein
VSRRRPDTVVTGADGELYFRLDDDSREEDRDRFAILRR